MLGMGERVTHEIGNRDRPAKGDAPFQMIK
jgi:hypothetical protein